MSTTAPSNVLRPHAEDVYAEELAALRAADHDRPKPPNWHLSPWATVTYLLGGKLDNGFEVEPKYIGQRRLMEIAVATLATDRALLLLGVPGTAKSWVSEHLTAAISGRSDLLVQGTAGTSEDAIRYSWNYARLIAEGPSLSALVPSPCSKACRKAASCASKNLPAFPPMCRIRSSPCSRKRCCPSPSFPPKCRP
ncbi:AAA family ATPase [Hymenobacter sp. J193]|nr:AAA family ATPase [Hymenobacter sp. J193]MCR5890044.1 AAA family ATPase [Hymenobacter sp. J193]